MAVVACTEARNVSRDVRCFMTSSFHDMDPAEQYVDMLAAQAGDSDAFTRLVRRHEQSLEKHLFRFTDNRTDLQDLRQETYIEVFRSISTYRHQGPFSCWLRRIASRVVYRHWARQAREGRAKAAYLELICRLSQNINIQHHLQDDMECIQNLLEPLSGEERNLLEMRYLQGLTIAEIAQHIQCNVGCTRVKLHRVLKKLRTLYGNGTSQP